MKKKKKVSTEDKKEDLVNNPFGEVDFSEMGFSAGKVEKPVKATKQKQVPEKKRGRVYVRLEKSGRGGKRVTVIEGIVGGHECRNWLKQLQSSCGCGGTLKGTIIEIQGDKCGEVALLLREAGFRVVGVS